MEEDDIIEENLLKGTTKPRKKFWIIFIIIGMLCIASAAYIIEKDFFKDEITPGNNISFEQFVCSQIRVTPTWVNKVGIVDEGYTNFNNSNSKDAVDLLINAKVYFVYHDSCSACQNQIGYFGAEWERYVNSGYTINCKDVS